MDEYVFELLDPEVGQLVLAGGSEVPHGDGGEERTGDSEGMGGRTSPPSLPPLAGGWRSGGGGGGGGRG